MRGSVLAFDGFTGFTPIQNRVISDLLGLTEKVIVTLTMDEREDPYRVDGEQKLFYEPEDGGGLAQTGKGGRNPGGGSRLVQGEKGGKTAPFCGESRACPSGAESVPLSASCL